MRLGLIARADNSGLGMQTWEFYNHMPVAKTLVVDMSGHNGNQQYPMRFPGAMWSHGIPNIGTIRAFLEGLDVVFVAEAPYNYMLYSIAREMGVKTAVQYNYEFFDWFKYTDFPKPDMLIAPSLWHYTDIERWCRQNDVQHIYLHCPVNRAKLPYRPPTGKAKTFLHVVGRAAAHDRNGTQTVIEASRHIKSDAVIKLHFQAEQGIGHQVTHTLSDYMNWVDMKGDREKLNISQHEYDNYEDIYEGSDVLLLPRRYGGNCLPMNEALSCGMPVIMTNISPNDRFLPGQWLIPADKVGSFTPRTQIDIYGATPEALAAKIDELARMNSDEFAWHNGFADGLAKKIDWKIMEPQYVFTLEQLCKS